MLISRVILEKAMAIHSSTLAWKIPWMEEPGTLQSMGSLRVGYDWATSLSLFTFMHWRRKWQPIPVFLPRESQGQGALWAAVSGVAQSRTWLKWLSSSSSLSLESHSKFSMEEPQFRVLKLVFWNSIFRMVGVSQSWTRLKWLSSSSLKLPFSTWLGSLLPVEEPKDTYI